MPNVIDPFVIDKHIDPYRTGISALPGWFLTGADPQKTPQDIEADFLRWLDRGEVRRMAELMATGSKTDKDRAAELIHALDHDWSFHGLGVVFLTGSGSPRKSMATKQAPPDAAPAAKKRRRKRRWRSEILPCHPAPTQ